MLIGERVQLRPIREADLSEFIAAHLDIRNRGAFFPLGVQSGPALRRQFVEAGFWTREEGTLLIWHDDEIVGHIEFFLPVRSRRGEVRVHPRGNRAGRVLQRWPQPRPPPLLAAPHRSSPLAPSRRRMARRGSLIERAFVTTVVLFAPTGVVTPPA